MKKSVAKQIKINRLKYEIKKKEKEERRLKRAGRMPVREGAAPIPLGTITPCFNDFCDKSFEKKSPAQRYCSPECTKYGGMPVADAWKMWKMNLDPEAQLRLKLQARQKNRQKKKKKRRTKRLGGPSMADAFAHEDHLFGYCLICDKEFERSSWHQKYCPYHGKRMREPKFRRSIEEGLIDQVVKEQVEGYFTDDDSV